MIEIAIGTRIGLDKTRADRIWLPHVRKGSITIRMAVASETRSQDLEPLLVRVSLLCNFAYRD